jgi:hypothetical protein
MSEPCKNCGAELFAGQRFCRACGNPTQTLDSGEAPTQQFADGALPAQGEATTRHMPPPDDWGARNSAHTAPQSRPHTNPVGRPPDTYQPPPAYQAPPTSYQLPPPPPAWQQPQYPPPPPARSSSSWAIVLAIILALLLGAVIGGRMIYNRVRERIRSSAQQAVTPPAPRPSATNTVALNKGASVSVTTISGDITIESWDKPQAEVQILGGNSNLPPPTVKTGSDNNSLSLETGANPSVSFKLKVPSDLGTVTIATASGAVKVTNVSGRISIATASGDMRLDRVTGLEKISTASGDVTAILSGAAKDHPLAISTASGDVRLTLPDPFDANFEARTMSGDIDVDEAFGGVSVTEARPGKHAEGQFGAGGPALTIKTASGDIEININK